MKNLAILLILAFAAELNLHAQTGQVTCTWPLPNTVVCCGPCACVVCSAFSTGDAGACIDIVLQCPNPQTSIARPLKFVARLDLPKIDYISKNTEN